MKGMKLTGLTILCGVCNAPIEISTGFVPGCRDCAKKVGHFHARCLECPAMVWLVIRLDHPPRVKKA